MQCFSIQSDVQCLCVLKRWDLKLDKTEKAFFHLASGQNTVVPQFT